MDDAVNGESNSSILARTWWALAPALVVPSIGTFFYFVILSGTEAGKVMLTVTKVFGLVWPILATLCILRRPFRRPVVGRPGRDVSIGLASGIAIGALIMALAWLTPLGEFLTEAAGFIEQKVADLGFTNRFFLLAIAISLVNSAMEEYYWRWFVYGNLRKVLRGKILPHLLAALAFTGHHIIVTTQFFPVPFALFLCFGVFVGGLIWSFLYQRQGHIFGAWICHVVVDLSIFTVAWQVIS